MRKALVTALLLPLLGTSIREPGSSTPPEPPPAGFPLHSDRATIPEPPMPSMLVVPLDREADGFRMNAPEQGVIFDIDGDGAVEQVAWPEAEANVALLALDHNGDGRITSGRELFGSATEPGAKNAHQALLRLLERSESERAGSIRAGHALYEQLLLWQDRNHNGRSDAGELTRARDHFVAIGLGYQSGDRMDAFGNRVRWIGWLEARDGAADQPQATSYPEHRERQRRSFEVQLRTLTGS